MEKVAPEEVEENNVEGGMDEKNPDEVQYTVEETPPPHLCLVLGFQHYISMFIATLTVPFLLAPVICQEFDDVGKAQVIGTLFVASGLITILQCGIGVRLPIVQAGTFALLLPTMAFFKLPQWECPSNIVKVIDNSSLLAENSTFILAGSDAHKEIWMSRLRVVQGSLMVAALFEVFMGALGGVGFLLRFIGPLSICPTVSLLGLSLFRGAAAYGAKQWWICIMTIFLMILFSQYLGRFNILCLSYKRGKGFHLTGYPLLRMFPVILGILISWFICFILTITDVLPRGPHGWGHHARTDLRTEVIYNSPWFRFPYPGQWGMPTVSVSCVFGLLSGIIATTLESVGDYHACARLAGAPPPPTHAINRGILIEGLGSFLDALLGTGNGTTSTSINVGVVGISKVGSRRVVQVSAVFMIVFGVLNKFGALFVTIPDPVIGGSFFILFGMIVAVGVSSLQHMDMNSSRNLFILGFSLFAGLSIPEWVKDPRNKGAIYTGNHTVDSVFTVLASTSMFMGGMIGFVLDNTIPGSPKERGLAHWHQMRLAAAEEARDPQLARRMRTVYDLPFGMNTMRRWPIMRYIPFCPTFGMTSSALSDQEMIMGGVTSRTAVEKEEIVRKRLHSGDSNRG